MWDVRVLYVQDPVRVHGALYALRIVARKYEFRDEEERGPLTAIINTSFPVSHTYTHTYMGTHRSTLTRMYCTDNTRVWQS